MLLKSKPGKHLCENNRTIISFKVLTEVEQHALLLLHLASSAPKPQTKKVSFDLSKNVVCEPENEKKRKRNEADENYITKSGRVVQKGEKFKTSAYWKR